MANFIEEFYYGNLDPQARSTKENKTVQKLDCSNLCGQHKNTPMVGKIEFQATY